MSAITVSGLSEIERFNRYALENVASIAELFADVRGMDDIVAAANKLNFVFSKADVDQYVRERTKASLSDEQLAMIVGGSTTQSWTSTWTWAISWAFAVNSAAAFNAGVVGVLVAAAAATVAVAVLVLVLI